MPDTTIHISEDLKSRLSVLAENTGLSEDELIDFALEQLVSGASTAQLSLRALDPTNDKASETWHHAALELAASRIRRARSELFAAGIIDESGERVSTDEPEDMRPGSNTSVITH